jgi:peptide/nickel transport system permease protein
MGAIVFRRLVALVPTLFIVSFLVFSLVTLIPGDPAVELAGGIDATQEKVDAIRAQLHLDDPFMVQYWDWLSNAVRGDFGESLRSGRSVTSEITRLMPVTASLVFAGITIGLVLGVTFGLLAGMRPGTKLDRGLMFGTTFGIAVPNFWLAMILISLISIKWGVWDLPALGFTRLSESPKEWLRSILLPGVALGVGVSAAIGRQLRAALQDTMSSNFVRTAWAKGLTTRRVVAKHALKNAAIPAITVLGLQIGALLGGTVLIERIFSIPGLGNYVLRGVQGLDLPVVQGVAILFVMINMTMSLLVDLAYGWLDPRVRVQ